MNVLFIANSSNLCSNDEKNYNLKKHCAIQIIQLIVFNNNTFNSPQPELKAQGIFPLKMCPFSIVGVVSVDVVVVVKFSNCHFLR